MRRLAKQDREDDYASRRDYQEIRAVESVRLTRNGGLTDLSWSIQLAVAEAEQILGIGGFIRASEGAELRSIISIGENILSEDRHHVGNEWVRIGRAVAVTPGAQVSLNLRFSAPLEHVDVWGLVASVAQLPGKDGEAGPGLEQLNVSHLLPETLYLDHSAELPPTLGGMDAVSGGAPIELKKCSYCGRTLPIGPGTAGRLSFHKHNAKMSGHQNECRACKKWRINDSFNPLRTSDQLNESSVITRERRLLLREAEILQRVKEREGRGLKSIVWDRFNRACFYCEKPLELKEVELDHTRPLSYLWPIDEHATCLCSEHNNHKKDRFPVDFYSEAQLVKLSEITGLGLAELRTRSVCEPELARIRENIVGFARDADPRAFNAIARKVIELRPDVDLWAELAEADKDTYLITLEGAQARPRATEAAGEEDDLVALEE